jgi:rod shape-determining protein MreB
VLIPEPVAGVVGCGLDPLEPRTHMVVNVGGGTSEATVFSFGGQLAYRSSLSPATR